MFFNRTWKVSAIELQKYFRGFSFVIILFVWFQSFLFSYLNLKIALNSGNQMGVIFKTINSHFESLIFSAIPLTIILTISNEFSAGYASKLISNGMTRHAFFESKLFLAGSLAILSFLLFTGQIFFFSIFSGLNLIGTGLFIESSAFVFFFSLFVYVVTVSISLLIQNWQYPVLIYFGYSFVELFMVYQFANKFPLIAFAPIHLTTSILEFERKLNSFWEIGIAISWLGGISFLLVTGSYVHFKNKDL